MDSLSDLHSLTDSMTFLGDELAVGGGHADAMSLATSLSDGHPLLASDPHPIVKGLIAPPPERTTQDDAIGQYVAQKKDKIAEGKSRVKAIKSPDGDVVGYERDEKKIGNLERAAVALSKKASAFSGKLAQAIYGVLGATKKVVARRLPSSAPSCRVPAALPPWLAMPPDWRRSPRWLPTARRRHAPGGHPGAQGQHGGATPQ